jgi:hypothetical protein
MTAAISLKIELYALLQLEHGFMALTSFIIGEDFAHALT